MCMPGSFFSGDKITYNIHNFSYKMLSIQSKLIKHVKTQSTNPEGKKKNRSQTKKPQVIQVLELVGEESNYD